MARFFSLFLFALSATYAQAPPGQNLAQALIDRGTAPGASAADRANLHRAFDSLVEYELSRAQPSQAASYAAMNASFYRTHERDYEAALRSARQAMELHQRAKEPIFSDLISIGEDLASLGRTAEALATYYQARQENPDPISRSAAFINDDIVAALLLQHDRTAAEREVEVIDRLALSAPPAFQARALLTRSDLLFNEGSPTAAFAAIRQAQGLVVSAEDRELLALEARAKIILGAIGALYLLPADEALNLARQLDHELPGMRFPLEKYAHLVVNQRRRMAGDIDGLLREDAASAQLAKQTGNIPAEIEALQSLAVTYSAVNGVHQQVVLLEEALRLDSPASPVSYLRTLDTLGNAYLEIQQIDAARNSFDTVLKIIAALDPETAIALQARRVQAVLGNARVLEMDDEPDDARAALQRILGDPSSTQQGFDKTEVLLQLARLERSLNERPVAAVGYYEQAIEAYREARSTSPNAMNEELGARLALTRYLTGTAAVRIPDARAKAEMQLQAIEQSLAQVQYAEGEWRVNFLRGILAEPAHPNSAIAFYREAASRLDRMRSGLTQQEQRQGLLDNEAVQELYSRLIALLTRTGRREEAWQYLERSRARSFLEMLQGRRFPSRDALPEVQELAHMEQQVASLRLQLAPLNVEVLRSVGREPARMRAELKSLEEQFAVARQQAALNQSRSGQVFSLEPAQLKEIQKRIPQRTTLIEYGFLAGQITAFVVTPAHIDQIVWKADIAQLHRDVDALRMTLEHGDSSDWTRLIDSVSSTLIEPVAKAIPASVEHLLIVPSGWLNYLPFAALHLPGGETLLETYATSYLPSASTLLFLGSPKPLHTDSNLFLGAIGNRTPPEMAPLPGTLREATQIMKVYPQASLATGVDFTHDAARYALLHYDQVHFATHGELDEDTPLFSAIVTSPADGQPSRLSLYEITQLSVKASMVVLSACKTGAGKLRGGDELTGLTRTFLTAGADTVVSSLWSVSDDSTALLMQGFYQGLHDGLSPAQALRRSALDVRVKYPHPHFWAPFVVTGKE